MASSSSSTNSTGRKYDVFLNFRGTDTRNNFTSHLHVALCNKGIDTFIDDRLERGKMISPALLETIENSRMSILVFSPDYASSTYCLDELVKILECRESKGQTVIPIFYNVNPEEVEKQTERYGEAFASHESMEDIEKVKVWKAALSTAASLSGWHLKNWSEADLIQRVVEELYNKMDQKILHVAENTVGLESHMEVMNHLLSVGLTDLRMVVVWGTGGIGKTTIAKAIFNRFVKAFEGSCFLANVRERWNKYGVSQLQETLLFEILGYKRDLSCNSDLGINVLKARLCNRKVFVVIDDVDHVDQLKNLAGDWFGPGSRIIITTRDKHLLISYRVQMYEVKGLRDEDALQLFSWNAFKKPQPEENYAKLSHCMLEYAGGLPLALVVLGSDLYGRSIPEWESYLRKLKRIPNKEIFEILRISFDGLEDNEKAIFLHVACFFRGSFENYVMQVLEACDFEPAWGIPILKEKSLISILYGKLQMHDLIQSMGWQIVHQESQIDPGERSRLWHHEDIVHVLTEDMGTHKIEAIMLDLPKGYEEVDLPAEAFTKMKNIKMLIIHNAHITRGIGTLPNELRWLEWPGYPSESLPFTSAARNLVALKMPNSLIKQLGVGLKNFKNLVSMDFSWCTSLTEIPDVSTISSLKKMNFRECTSLANVHQSIGFLEKLNFLIFSGCSNLKSLPTCFELVSLEVLHVDRTKLEKLPNFKNCRSLKSMNFRNCECLMEIPDLSSAPNLEWMNFRFCPSLIRIHPSIGFLEKLEVLDFSNCSNLASLPSCFKLRSLQYLFLTRCFKLEELPNMEYMASLRQLHLSWTAIKELPPSIEFLLKLKLLDFTNCYKLADSQGNNLENLRSYFDNTSLEPFIVVLPGGEILPWFHYKSEGNSLSIQLPSNIEAVLFCIIIAPGNLPLSLECEVFVNGWELCSLSPRCLNKEDAHEFESDHMLFGKVLREDFVLQQRLFNLFGGSVEIQFSVPLATVKTCGAYLVLNEDDDHPESNEYSELHEHPQRKRMRMTDEHAMTLSNPGHELQLSLALPLQTRVLRTESNEDSELHEHPQRKRMRMTDEHAMTLSNPGHELQLSLALPLQTRVLRTESNEDSELHEHPQRKRMRMTDEHAMTLSNPGHVLQLSLANKSSKDRGFRGK